MTTFFESKEAKALDRLVDVAFDAGKIKEDTHKAGKMLALAMNTVHMNRKHPSPAIDKTRDEFRDKFAELLERDTGKTTLGD